MKLEQLIDQFELVTDTEEGLEQLRKVILNQAIRGNLTKQDQNDESAEIHLERIEAEKKRLYDEGEIRKPKDLPPVKSEEVPHEIPNNWIWARLGEIGDWGAGATPTRSNSEYFGGDLPWLKTGELNDGFISSSEETVTKKGLKNSSLRLCKTGDVLIAMYGATIGKLGILEIEATTNQACCACTPYADFNNLFLFYYLLALRDNFRSQGAGGAQPNISKTKIEHTLLSLPPVEEQQRIVQKIETLFAQVDELEQKVQHDQELDERLQVAVLDDLQSAETPEASRQSWKRLTNHFDQIYRKPEHIDQLKQAILNEAVRGRLVRQSADPNDEPAEKLLERIKEEKQRLYDEGEIRKPKDLPEITDEEIPYELPEGWCWERFGNLGVINPRNEADDDIEASFVPMKMISKNFSYKHNYEIKKWKEIRSGYTHFAEGDIGLAKITPCFENGKAAIFQNLKNGIGAGTTELYIFRPVNNTILNRFAYLYLQTPKFRVEGKNKMTGTAGQQRVPKSYFEEALFPLPPFNEQKQIIRKIYDLFDWCDDLKEKLSHSQQTDQRLLEALVNGVSKNKLADSDGKS